MKIAMTDLPLLLTNYVDKHMLPKLKGKHAFALGAGTLLMQQAGHVSMQNEKFTSAALGLQLLDTDGFFDMDKAREAALAGVKRAGGKVTISLYKLPLLGELEYSFDAEEIENFYKVAAEMAHEDEL